MKETMMRNTMIRVAAVACAAAALAQPLRAQDYHRQTEARPAPVGSLVIQNLDALWTGTGETMHNVSIAVVNGVITAIGGSVDVPRGATVIDGRGFTAMPGIVDEHTHTAMSGGSNEGTAPVV